MKTIEERAKKVLSKWKALGENFDYVLTPGTNLTELIFAEWIAEEMRELIEDAAQIVDAEIEAGEFGKFILAEVAMKIRALAGPEQVEEESRD